MFEVGFTELLLIFALALVVLGPRRLPELANKVGRWVGRARAMARQLREQLDQEVNFEEQESRRTQTAAAAAAAPDDSDLQVDPEGRPYYPPDHHGSDHTAADIQESGVSAAEQASTQPEPSIRPEATAPGPAADAAPPEEPSVETSEAQQGADEKRSA